jgi:hypothetical protein
MPKRSTSLHVPKDMQARFEEITQLTDAFCHTYLNDEYVQLSRELTATLCHKRLRRWSEARPPSGPVGSFMPWAWSTFSSIPRRPLI